MSEVATILAEFSSPATLVKAVKELKNAGYTNIDTYTPFPIHGMDDALALKPSKLGWIVLGGGLVGLIGGFALQTWVATRAYPLIVSGKPLFSYQAFIPVTFELMILCAAFATVFGMFALNKLPQHYHPIFKSKAFEKASSHGFFIGIDGCDKTLNASTLEKTTLLLQQLGGTAIEVIRT